MMRRYVARFTPEVWINDYAVGVDPYESEQEWDCTDYLGLLRSDSTGVYAGRLLAVALLREIEVRGDAIDTCDVLRDDPEPSDQDYLLDESDRGAKLYSMATGRLVFETAEGGRPAVLAFMRRDGYWPAVWVVSDHGNAHLVTDWDE